MTKKWAKDRGLIVVNTPGIGFVADMVSGVMEAGIEKPVLIIMADLPLVTADLIDEIMDIYDERPEPALSAHTPLGLHSRLGRRPDSLFNYKGQLIVPSGINVLDGNRIKEEQEDYHLIMERLELAVNVNTAEDLRLCERIMMGCFI
jgi:adenosylcobinamide-phosphate guanylyltransferase